MENFKIICKKTEYPAKVVSFDGEILIVSLEETLDVADGDLLGYCYEDKCNSARVLRVTGNNILLHVPVYSANISGERRLFPRYTLHLALMLTDADGKKIPANLQNISLHGMGIKTESPIDPGIYSFTLTDLEISGRIEINESRGGTYGCKFVFMSRNSKYELRRLLLKHQLDLLGAQSQVVPN